MVERAHLFWLQILSGDLAWPERHPVDQIVIGAAPVGLELADAPAVRRSQQVCPIGRLAGKVTIQGAPGGRPGEPRLERLSTCLDGLGLQRPALLCPVRCAAGRVSRHRLPQFRPGGTCVRLCARCGGQQAWHGIEMQQHIFPIGRRLPGSTVIGDTWACQEQCATRPRNRAVERLGLCTLGAQSQAGAQGLVQPAALCVTQPGILAQRGWELTFRQAY